MYRALIESTAFGARVIIDNFDNHGVPVNELVIAGGLQKNKMLMQIYADITGRPLSIVDSDQAPALGSAIHAAVAAGAYASITEAAENMGKIRQNVYTPIANHQKIYDQIFNEYQSLHDYFGRGTNNVMKRLKTLRLENHS
jgi:L-ribulokinase